MNSPSVPTNPLLEKLLKQASKGHFELIGYPAPYEKGPIRIYRDLSLEKYLEIPYEEILEFVEASDPNDPVRIFFKSSAIITYTQMTKISESVSITGTISFPADEVKRLVQFRSKRLGSSRCRSAQPGGTVIGRSIDARPGGGGGGELPPEECEINCEEMLNICIDSGFDSEFWCYVDYYLCRLDCILGPSTVPGGVLV